MFSLLLKFLLPAALAFGGGLYAAHRWDEATIAAMTLAQAKADAAAAATRTAIVEAQDKASLAAAVGEAMAQQKLADQRNLIPREVRIHVPGNRVVCIPYGLVRVLDAATAGVDPSGLPLPAGQSNVACAPVTAAALAAGVAANYATARQNAEQLNALEAWLRAEANASPHQP